MNDKAEIYQILEQNVLRFFNTVSTIDQISKRIIDDPNFERAYGETYGIDLFTAKKILRARDGCNAKQFESIAQLEKIEGIGFDKIHDILYSFLSFSSFLSETKRRERYNEAIKQNVLKFFNEASKASEIVERIKDDPNLGIRPNGIGISAEQATKILAIRDKLKNKKFIDLNQIQQIKGIGADSFHDILFSFWMEEECVPVVSITSPLPETYINEITFDLQVTCYSASKENGQNIKGEISLIEVLRNGEIILKLDSHLSKEWSFQQKILGVGVADYMNSNKVIQFEVKAYKKTKDQLLVGISNEIKIMAENIKPVISNISPENGSFINLRRPMFTGLVSDLGGSGLNIFSSVTALLDRNQIGIELLQNKDGSLKFMCQSKLDIPDGQHELQILASDRAGNISTRNISFNLDATKPSITSIYPTIGSFHDSLERISAHISDEGGSGLDPETIELTLNGEQQQVTYTQVAENSYDVFCVLKKALPNKLDHQINISVKDKAGNITETGEVVFFVGVIKNYFEYGQLQIQNNKPLWAEYVWKWGGDEQSMMALGKLMEDQGRTVDAINAYQSSSTIEARNRLIRLYRATNNMTSLIEVVDNIIKESSNKNAICLKGNIMAQTGKLNEAELLWKSSFTMRSFYNLACLECSRSNKSAAINYIKLLASKGGAWLSTLSKDDYLKLIREDLPSIPGIKK